MIPELRRVIEDLIKLLSPSHLEKLKLFWARKDAERKALLRELKAQWSDDPELTQHIALILRQWKKVKEEKPYKEDSAFELPDGTEITLEDVDALDEILAIDDDEVIAPPFADRALEPPDLLRRYGNNTEQLLECSAFSRESVRPNQLIMATVAVHLPEEAKEAAKRALGRDPKAEMRESTSLTTRIPIGTSIYLHFEVEGGETSFEGETFEWTGEMHLARVMVRPETNAEEVYFSVTLSVGGIPIGDISWVVLIDQVEANESKVAQSEPFTKPFVSYSSLDRGKVAPAVASLQAVGSEPFLDYHSLHTGDEFSSVIEQIIGECDLFMVYWSANADASCWVHREMELAMARWKASQRKSRRPRLWPVTLERDYPEPPLEWKSNVHFDNIITMAGFAHRARTEQEPH